jgi:phosphate transport system substrate-binding protein
MSPDSQGQSGPVSRRQFVAASGTLGAVALAGCNASTLARETRNGDGGTNDGGGGRGSLSGEISITGSSTVFPLASAVAEEFQKMHDGVDVSIKSTGSGGGFENFFCPGDSHINNASRPIKDSERETCNSNDVQVHEVTVATDALTVVVNNDNDWATEMTVDELAQIWGPEAESGQTWADVNADWPDEEIERFGAAETSGTFDYFTENVTGEVGAHTQDYEPTENDRLIVQGVQGSEYAIGYFGFSYYYNNPEAVTAVAIDNGDGPVEPSLETASSGEYQPLARDLYTYPAMSALAQDHVAEFVRYFVEQSANEELVAEQVGYVPRTQEQVQTAMENLESAIEEANA